MALSWYKLLEQELHDLENRSKLISLFTELKEALKNRDNYEGINTLFRIKKLIREKTDIPIENYSVVIKKAAIHHLEIKKGLLSFSPNIIVLSEDLLLHLTPEVNAAAFLFLLGILKVYGERGIVKFIYNYPNIILKLISLVVKLGAADYLTLGFTIASVRQFEGGERVEDYLHRVHNFLIRHVTSALKVLIIFFVLSVVWYFISSFNVFKYGELKYVIKFNLVDHLNSYLSVAKVSLFDYISTGSDFVIDFINETVKDKFLKPIISDIDKGIGIIKEKRNIKEAIVEELLSYYLEELDNLQNIPEGDKEELKKNISNYAVYYSSNKRIQTMIDKLTKALERKENHAISSPLARK